VEIHKPKPVHNWRELVTEIGVVCIGVCIALGAEQTLEWLHWRSQVAEAREVIATELAYTVENAILRVRAQPCMEARLDELARGLDGAAKSGSLPPVGDIGLPPRNAWRNGAWESVVASQTATHFPRQQLAGISHVYKSIEMLAQVYQMEAEDWYDLYAIVGPGRRLDPASEADLRKALSRARSTSRSLVSLGAVTMQRIKDLDLSFSPEDLSMIDLARHIPLTGSKQTVSAGNSTAAICGPIGAVPATYGQGQFSTLPSQLDGMVKAIPDFSVPHRERDLFGKNLCMRMSAFGAKRAFRLEVQDGVGESFREPIGSFPS
jgi:hypothetical protein